MKILTIGSCPYLLTNLGRLNANILEHLTVAHEVASAVWHHDDAYFMPGEDGRYIHDHTGVELFPFQNAPEIGTAQVYDIIQKYEPEVVITIGDYHEVAFLHLIKEFLPDAFKWVAVVVSAATPVNEQYYKFLSSIDVAILTNHQNINTFQMLGIESSVHSVGIERLYSRPSQEAEDFRVLCVGKNAHISNIAMFMAALSGVKDEIHGYLHTNLHDPGDYDIDLLCRRYVLEGRLELPQTYSSIKQGLSPEELNRLYGRFQVVVDCSLRSATAMSVLEAMATGCVPIVNRCGALAEVADAFEMSRLESEPFISEREEELWIPSLHGLVRELEWLYFLWKENRGLFQKRKELAENIAKRFDRKDFVREVEQVINQVTKRNNPILSVEKI